MFHREINTSMAKELIFEALRQKSAKGFREEPTLKAIWEKLHSER